MKKQRPNERAESERTRRQLARYAARFIQNALDSLDRAAVAAEDSNEERRAREDAKVFWETAGVLITSRRNPAKFLHMIADAMEGKLKNYRAGWYDDMIDAAEEAVMFRKINGRLDINFDAPFADFKKAFKSEWKKRGNLESQMPEDRSLRRARKRRGHVLNKRGRPKKK